MKVKIGDSVDKSHTYGFYVVVVLILINALWIIIILILIVLVMNCYTIIQLGIYSCISFQKALLVFAG